MVGYMINLVRKVFLITLMILGATAVHAQSPPAENGRTVFRIGYIRQDPESVTTTGVFQRMREFLLAQAEIQASMELADVHEIMLQSFDSHRLLVEAMDAEQLDLAFCSVIDYGYQRGSYEPVFQLRRPGDPHSSTGNRRVWHSGVILVNNRSPLFDMPATAAATALPEYLQSREIAMVGSSSAAGYVYPYLALDRLTTGPTVSQVRSVFWGSSTEVVKAVLNGIHEVGACDASAIDEVLNAYGLSEHKNHLLKVVLRTDPVPRDPVVLHTRWLNSSGFQTRPQAELGRRLTRAVAGFFETDPALPTLDRTTRDAYLEVTENVQRFQSLR